MLILELQFLGVKIIMLMLKEFIQKLLKTNSPGQCLSTNLSIRSIPRSDRDYFFKVYGAIVDGERIVAWAKVYNLSKNDLGDTIGNANYMIDGSNEVAILTGDMRKMFSNMQTELIESEIEIAKLMLMGL